MAVLRGTPLLRSTRRLIASLLVQLGTKRKVDSPPLRRGVHLQGSEDTEYKKALFDTCNELAREMTLSELGMELQGKETSFAVIHGDERERKLNELFA